MIKTSKEIIISAQQEINNFQEGRIRPAITSIDHFNSVCLGGIIPGMIIVIAGISEMGKTHLLNTIENDFLDDKLNIKASSEHVLLQCNWEMLGRDIMIRNIKTKLNISQQEILYSKNKTEIINDFLRKEIRQNKFFQEESLSPLDWYNEIDQFLIINKNKNLVLITVDHLSLVINEDNLKKAIDKLLTYANMLKKKYKNVSFIFISQLNREIEYRTDIRFLNPIRSDLYASDAIFHIADIICVKHIPYNLGHSKYMMVQSSKYNHIKEFMLNPNMGNTSFKTDNVVFYHYLKIRNKEKNIPRLYCEYFDKNIISYNKPVKGPEIEIYS